MASVILKIFRYFEAYINTLLTLFNKCKSYFGNSFASITNDFTFQKEDDFKTEVVNTWKFPLQFTELSSETQHLPLSNEDDDNP